MKIENIADYLAHTCTFCNRSLCEDDVTMAFASHKRKKVAKRGSLNPGDVLCQRKDCKRSRRDKDSEFVPNAPVDEKGQEDADFKNVGSRVTEFGEVRTELPRHDFVNATSHELGERGVPSREPKTDLELLSEIIGKISEPVVQPPTIDAAVLATYDKWFREDAPESLRHPLGQHGARNRKLLLQYITDTGGAVTRESLSAAVPMCSLTYVPRAIKVRDLPGGRPVPEVEPKAKRGRPKKIQQIDESAPRWKRRELGLTPRQVVKHMSDPKFNQPIMLSDTDLLSTDPYFIKELAKVREMEASGKHYPETIQRHYNKLKNKLPLKEQRTFTDGQIRFYEDYASGKFSDDGLAYIHGAPMVSGLISLENDIVEHLVFQRVIEGARGDGNGRYNESLEHAWDLEAKAIANGSADGGTIIGSKYKQGLGKSFSRYGLSSFDVGYQTKFRSRGGESGESGPAYSDSGDDREE